MIEIAVYVRNERKIRFHCKFKCRNENFMLETNS